MRLEREAVVPPFVPVTHPRFAAARAVADIVQQLDVRRAPARLAAQAHAAVVPRLAQRQIHRALRAPVAVVALEAVADEGIEAPVVLLELEAEARSVEVTVLAFIQVERNLVRAALGAAVSRVLPAQNVPHGRAAGLQHIDERIARCECLCGI